MTGETHADAASGDPARRLDPSLFDADWLVMRDLAAAIRAAAAKAARPGDAAIDFGCGSMPYRPVFEAAGCAYRGADLDGTPDIAILPGGRMDVADDSADLVLSFQVLEHVRDLAPYFAETHRVLRPGGRLILSTHGTWLYHPHPEDHRRWTREGLIGELESHGFSVVDCAPVVGPLAWTTVLRLTCWRYALRKVPLADRAIGWLFSLVMNLRALVEDAITPAAIKQDNACVYVITAIPGARSAKVESLLR